MLGVFRVQLDTFTPSKVPRRLRSWLRENEPHRASNPGAANVITSNLLGLLNLPARMLFGLLKGIFSPFYGLAWLVHGKAWEGGWESGAGQFMMRVLAGRKSEDFDNKRCLLALTSQRLLALDDPISPETYDPFLLAELPRGAFSLRREPHPARQKTRVDIAFSDGSWLALDTGRVKNRPEVERLLAG
jgi:hypothetical protein